MAKKKKDIVLSPLEDGNQKYAIRSNADIVVFTGDTGGGKSYALYYAPIDYLASEPDSKIVCFMRNISDFWGAGKVADTLKKMYPLIDRAAKRQPHDPIGELLHKETDMGMRLYNGSEIKFQQLDNESPVVIEKIAKGLQAKKLIFDECNKFVWRTVTSFMPRLRSSSGGKAQIFLAQNPERECFLRQLCGKGEHGGGWIKEDGTIDESMDGVVMYFNMQDGEIGKTYFGRTKREVYEKCKDHIDALLKDNPDMSYEDFILSMAFFTFNVRDNKKMLRKNKQYRGFAANSATAMSSFSANWNYSITDEEPTEADIDKVQVTPLDIERMFRAEEIPYDSICEKRFMTLDMATTGFDNLILMYWEKWSKYGFVCRDIQYSIHNKNTEAVVAAIEFREKHNLREKDMILDVQGFGYLAECFPHAISITGAGAPSPRGKNQFVAKKDECGHLAMQMIQSGLVHFEPRLADAHYFHKNMKRTGGTTFLKHYIFESRIFQFYKTPNGRLAMMAKENQKKLLKGMSPDLTDNIILLCGGMVFDCYRMLQEDAGISRKRVQASDMLTLLDINNSESAIKPYQKQKIKNSHEILQILSTI